MDRLQRHEPSRSVVCAHAWHQGNTIIKGSSGTCGHSWFGWTHRLCYRLRSTSHKPPVLLTDNLHLAVRVCLHFFFSSVLFFLPSSKQPLLPGSHFQLWLSRYRRQRTGQKQLPQSNVWSDYKLKLFFHLAFQWVFRCLREMLTSECVWCVCVRMGKGGMKPFANLRRAWKKKSIIRLHSTNNHSIVWAKANYWIFAACSCTLDSLSSFRVAPFPTPASCDALRLCMDETHRFLLRTLSRLHL